MMSVRTGYKQWMNQPHWYSEKGSLICLERSASSGDRTLGSGKMNPLAFHSLLREEHG